MPNPYRGEIEARLDGAPYRLCLTLGALAELESAFGDDRHAGARRALPVSGRLSARDAVRIIAAGLRGAGHDIADEAVARMQAEGGAAGFVDIVARLLAATFGGGRRIRDRRAGTIPRAAASTEGRAPPSLSLARRDGRRPRPPAPPAGALLVHDPRSSRPRSAASSAPPPPTPPSRAPPSQADGSVPGLMVRGEMVSGE